MYNVWSGVGIGCINNELVFIWYFYVVFFVIVFVERLIWLLI